MLRYFKFASEAVLGVYFVDMEETVKEVNKFAEENNLKIMQILACKDDGIFVVFEKLN